MYIYTINIVDVRWLRIKMSANTFSTGLLFQLFLFYRFFVFSSSQKRSGLANTFFRLSLSWTQKYSWSRGTNISNAFVWFFLETDTFCSKEQDHKVQWLPIPYLYFPHDNFTTSNLPVTSRITYQYIKLCSL